MVVDSVLPLRASSSRSSLYTAQKPVEARPLAAHAPRMGLYSGDGNIETLIVAGDQSSFVKQPLFNSTQRLRALQGQCTVRSFIDIVSIACQYHLNIHE